MSMGCGIILNWAFNPINRYITRPQAMQKKYGDERVFGDFHTFELQQDRRIYFLITQCKATKGEGEGELWRNGSERLRAYLENQHGNRPVAQRTPVYGILAVGRRVRFFRYNDANQAIDGWRPGAAWAATHDDKEFYDIVHEPRLVQSALRFILQNH